MVERAQQPARTNLSNRQLHHLLVFLAVALVVLAVVYLLAAGDSSRPGSPLQQGAAIVGSLLLLMPFVFSIKKRGGRADVPNRLFVVHVVASVVGIALVCVHAFASLNGPPLLMLLCLVLLVISGFVGRVVMARSMASTLGTKAAAFMPADDETKAQLKDLIAQKQAVLDLLDSEADEAVFSVTLSHWLRAPRLALRYQKLAAKESSLIGSRGSVSSMQAWWRIVHMLLAWGFLFGLIVHVVVATFFAGYVADGREIYWWHLTAW